ncbi:MAG TPA: hypothetical protein VEH30_15765, partial [Terriglobales bacterium]|nr:hypothetical protein [Terriglobales bacterium]
MDRVQNLGMGPQRRLVDRFAATAASHAKQVALTVCSALLVLNGIPLARSQEVGQAGGAKLQTKTPEQIQSSEPAGADRCTVCHPSEVQGFARSAMAHALRRARNEP